MDMKNMAITMVSMKKKKQGIAGAKKMGEGEAMGESEDEYPYGLSISIDAEKWAELTGGMELPQVGEQVHMCINAAITAVRAPLNEMDEAGLSLQITDAGIMKDKKQKKSAAQALYGEGEE